jgi:hypothetical protein
MHLSNRKTNGAETPHTVVADDPPTGLCRGAGQEGLQEAGEILFGAGVVDAPLDLSGGHVEASDQRLRAVAAAR